MIVRNPILGAGSRVMAMLASELGIERTIARHMCMQPTIPLELHPKTRFRGKGFYINQSAFNQMPLTVNDSQLLEGLSEGSVTPLIAN